MEEADIALLKRLGGLPSIAQARPISRPKPTPKSQVHWTSYSLTNPCRIDGLRMDRWKRGVGRRPLAPPQSEEGLRGFNAPADVPTFTSEEYFLHLTDPNWSKAETEYLLQLCRDYNLRFFIIADRYDFPEKERTLEEIQDRYYRVARRLQTIRRNGTGESIDLTMFDYSKDKEMKRREHLLKLVNRPKDQLEREEAYMLELRAIDANWRRLSKNRAWLENLFFIPANEREGYSRHGEKRRRQNAISQSLEEGSDSSRMDVREDNGVPSLLARPSAAQISEGYDSAVSDSSEAATDLYKAPKVPKRFQKIPKTIHKKKERRKEDKYPGGDRNVLVAEKARIAIPPTLTPRDTQPHHIALKNLMTPARKAQMSGVQLRTDRIYSAGKVLGPKINEILLQYGLPSKPVMPTARVVAAFEQAVRSAIRLYEAEKQCDQIKTDLLDYQQLTGMTLDAAGQPVPASSKSPPIIIDPPSLPIASTSTPAPYTAPTPYEIKMDEDEIRREKRRERDRRRRELERSGGQFIKRKARKLSDKRADGTRSIFGPSSTQSSRDSTPSGPSRKSSAGSMSGAFKNRGMR